MGRFAQTYAAGFVLVLVLWPLLIPAVQVRAGPVPISDWSLAAVASLGSMALFWSVQRRCSNDRLIYWDGLLVVTASMMTGWMYTSLVVVFPVLFGTFLASVAFAVHAGLRGEPGGAALRFQKLVRWLYERRMRP